MANVTLMGASYSDVPAVTLPQTGGGTVTFYENGGGGGGANISQDQDGYIVLGSIAGSGPYVTGTFTTGSSETTYTISFGETISKYLFLIEMTDESKATLASSGNASPRSYAFTGMYPSPGISNSAPANCMTTYRMKSSTSELSYSQTTVNATASSINIGCTNLDGGAHYLYRGYSYKYTITKLP